MNHAYFLVETEEKGKTLQAILQGRGQALVAPAIAAVVEAKNTDRLARGEEGFLFRPTVASQDVLQKILQGVGGEIYLAFERNARGEYSSWLWAGMIGQLSKGGRQCRRLHLSTLDDEGVTTAMALVEPVDAGQGAAYYFAECFQQCLVGHLQRLLGTRTGPGNIPLTIPVLAILALMAQREQELRRFSGRARWQVTVALQGARGVLPARVQEVFGVCCDGKLAGREQAKAVAEDLAGQGFRVAARQEEALEIEVPSPYTLYELMFDAWRYGRLPLPEALQAASGLAAGVEVGDRRRALLSSLHGLTPARVQPLTEAVGRQVVALFGPEALQGRVVVASAIMPVDPGIGPQDLAGLPDGYRKIYELVWQRAMASQMRAAVGKEITLDLETDTYRLQSDFRVVEAPGFLQVFQHGFAGLLDQRPDDIPVLADDATVTQVVPEQRFDLVADQYTLPGLADDLHELGIARPEEVVGILGRLIAAGYCSMQDNGTLQGGATLFKVVNILNKAFPGMQGLSLVAYYGQTIAEVTAGRKRFQMGLKQFDQTLMMQGRPLVKATLPTSLPPRLKQSKSIIKGDGAVVGASEAAPKTALTEAPCVDFGRPTTAPLPPVEVTADAAPGQTSGAEVEEEALSTPVMEPAEPVGPGAQDLPGEADLAQGPEAPGPLDLDAESVSLDEGAGEQTLAAPTPEVEKLFQEAAEQLPEPPVVQVATGPPSSLAPTAPEEKIKGVAEVATRPCPECGRPRVEKGDRFGRYWACTGAPACRYTEGAQSEAPATDAPVCPLCGEGRLVVKRTPTGKDMYLCQRPACEFMAWSRPHALHCPLCSSPFLVEKKGADGGTVLCCPKAGCNYCRGLADGDGQGVAVKKRVVVRRTKGGKAGGTTRRVVVRRRK
jgi:DNA topoisomerase IA/ssDNA-binding Zn-finger/Zn-ribbon topoisomerase 1